MRIGVRSERDLGVSQLVLDDLERDARGGHVGGDGVPELVEADGLFDLRLLREPLQELVDRLGVQGFSIGTRETKAQRIKWPLLFVVRSRQQQLLGALLRQALHSRLAER